MQTYIISLLHRITVGGSFRVGKPSSEKNYVHRQASLRLLLHATLNWEDTDRKTLMFDKIASQVPIRHAARREERDLPGAN